jgi:endonuclease G
MLTSVRRATAVLAFLVLTTPARAAEGDEHLLPGNPSGATADRAKPDNYLVRKPQYVLSYNNSKGTPNWVAWQLSKKWLGRTRRANPFAPDTSLPAGFFKVRPNDYRAAGFDRGHMCPAADRSVSKEAMDVTFLMSNMVPQSPDLNRKTWEKLEEYCRSVVRERDRDLYIVAGPAGQGGLGSDGSRAFLRGSGGRITVPGKCWKVVLVVPAGATDAKRLSAEQVRVFAVIMPNMQGLNADWRTYAVPVRDVEELTGLSFFTNLTADVAEQLRARKPETRSRAEKVAKGEKAPKEKANKKGKRSELELPEWVEGCVIGNRVSKKFHAPGGRGYAAARKSKNAVFFRNAQDAEKAGYTAAKR